MGRGSSRLKAPIAYSEGKRLMHMTARFKVKHSEVARMLMGLTRWKFIESMEDRSHSGLFIGTERAKGERTGYKVG